MDALTRTPFTALAARDLMSHEVLTICAQLSLRTAAHLLAQARVSGAPVVDERGVCVGVLSATDFLRMADYHGPHPGFGRGECVCSDWQMVVPDELPSGEVGDHMTPDPVTASPGTGVRELARMMLDAHIHRVIVTDPAGRPVGVVSSTDVLAAVAGLPANEGRPVAGPEPLRAER